MRRLLLLLLPFALLGVTACNSAGGGLGTPPAAVVNGTEISAQVLLDNANALADNEGVRSNLESQGVAINGPTEGSFSSAFTTQVLSSLVIDVLIQQELDERGASPTEAELADAETQLASATGFPEAFIAQQTTSLANRTALERVLAEGAPPLEVVPVTDADVEAYFNENIASISEQYGSFICASHILVETLDEANAIAARLDAGEDFATIAGAESSDTQSAAYGGDLGCQPEGSYVPEFEAAAMAQPLGEVGDPVQTEFGYHLIVVRSRGELPLDEVRDDIRQVLEDEQQAAVEGQASGLFDAWLAEAANAAEVTVDAKWGLWSPELAPLLVSPPEGASLPATGEPLPLDLGG